MSETKAEKKERLADEKDAAEVEEMTDRSFEGAVYKQNVTEPERPTEEVTAQGIHVQPHDVRGRYGPQPSAPPDAYPDGKVPYDKTREGGTPVPNPMRGTNPPLKGVR